MPRSNTLADMLMKASPGGASPVESGANVHLPLAEVVSGSFGAIHLYAARFRASMTIRSRTTAMPGLHLALLQAGNWRSRTGRTLLAQANRPALVAFTCREPASVEGLLDARTGAALFGMHLPWEAVQELDVGVQAALLAVSSGERPLALTGRLQHIASGAVAAASVRAGLSQMALQARFLDVLIELGEANASGATTRRHGRVADRAAEMLVADMRVLPDLETVARELGVSGRVLRDAFLQRHGTGMQAFARSARLEHGRRLLLETDLPVGQVAAEVGYSPAHFSTAFLRAFGRSPGAVRGA